MVGEAYKMKGSEMKTLKDEELNKWKQAETERERERHTDQKEGLNFTIKEE